MSECERCKQLEEQLTRLVDTVSNPPIRFKELNSAELQREYQFMRTERDYYKDLVDKDIKWWEFWK
tara:strand:+ start:273 stop:470 length:198 start_codon:yes stop_codon:yes gene_type:complete